MYYIVNQLVFSIPSAGYNSFSGLKFSDLDFYKSFIKEVIELKVFNDFKYYYSSKSPYIKGTELKSNVKLNKLTYDILADIDENKTTVIVDKDNVKNATKEIQIVFFDGEVNVDIFLHNTRCEDLPVLTNELVTFFRVVYSRFNNNKLMLFYFSFLHIYDIDFPKLKPPKFIDLRLHKLVDIYCYNNTDDKERKEFVTELLKRPKPVNADIIVTNDYYIINWVNGICGNLDDIKRMLQYRYEWYCSNFALEIESGYNIMGDVQEVIFYKKPATDFTFYEYSTFIGYKATTYKENDIDLTLLDVLDSIIKKGKDSDGNIIKEVRLILPSRKAAIKMSEFCKDKYLFTGFYYMHDNAQLWNPFPPGNWLN